MKPVGRDCAESYSWGTGCLGWHLLQLTDLSVIQEEMPPGTQEERHLHRQSRQFFYVLHGELVVECDGVRHVVGERTGLEIRPMTPHQARNDSGQKVEFLVISQPPSHGDREVVEMRA